MVMTYAWPSGARCGPPLHGGLMGTRGHNRHTLCPFTCKASRYERRGKLEKLPLAWTKHKSTHEMPKMGEEGGGGDMMCWTKPNHRDAPPPLPPCRPRIQ